MFFVVSLLRFRMVVVVVVDDDSFCLCLFLSKNSFLHNAIIA